MNRTAKLWWRIAAAALLVSMVAANIFLGMLFFATSPIGILTYAPAHYEIIYELYPPAAQGGKASHGGAATTRQLRAIHK